MEPPVPGLWICTTVEGVDFPYQELDYRLRKSTMTRMAEGEIPPMRNVYRAATMVVTGLSDCGVLCSRDGGGYSPDEALAG